MIINLIYDAAAQAAPAAFRNTMQQAANLIGSMFTDNITVNINIDYSGTGGGAAAGPDNGVVESYSTVYNYLTQSHSPGDSSFDYLPAPGSANAPSSVVVWNAELKAMGLLSPNSTSTDDGSATFATDINPSLLLGVALHELTHAMGRVPYGLADMMELDRFSSAGNRVYDGNVPAGEASYFSLNGGLTKWADYGENSDPSDFMNKVNYGGDGTSPLTPNDPFNQYYTSSTLQYLTPVDLEQMDVLGFHLKYDAPAEDAYDFNGSNSGDILLQSVSGQIKYANMAGGSFQNFVNVTTTPGWAVVGEGKISGNVDSNIVIQNPISGQIAYANMANGLFNGWTSVAGTPGWSVRGVGDINDDHYADILIQNQSNGQIIYANMDNGVFNGWVSVTGTPGWAVVGVGDIQDDGYDDIVIQNQVNGQIAYAIMDNGIFNGWTAVAGTPGWNVVGVGDINGSGYSNIVIQNQSNGQILYANMLGGVFNGWVAVAGTPGWNVVAVEDVLGNGFDDIVIQNQSNGQVAYADMTAGVFNGWDTISNPSGYIAVSGPAPTGNGSSSASAFADGLGTAFADAVGDAGTNPQGPSNPPEGTLADAGTNPGQDSSNSYSLLPGILNDGGTNPQSPIGTLIHLPMFNAWAYLDGDGDDLPPGVWDAVGPANNSPPSVSDIGSNPPGAISWHDAISSAALDHGSPSNGQVPLTTSGGGVADYLNNGSNNGGSVPEFVPNSGGISANWLTEGAQNDGAPTSGAAQVPGSSGLGSNPATIVAADTLQNLLHSGSNG